MNNFRKYGSPPYNVVVVHGGPGAAGEMAPVAQELSKSFGVIEPFQTKLTIDELVLELKEIIEKNGSSPVTLIGYSWGAMLGVIFSALHPNLVKKLILVSSAVFDESYAKNITPIRLSRMNDEEKIKLQELEQQLSDLTCSDKNKLLNEFGKLFSKIDSFDPIDDISPDVDGRVDIYESVWKEAVQLRSSGKLLEYAKCIVCPVVAIHGDYDPHPVDGIKIPLSKVMKSFKFILLKDCGHHPWLERRAKDAFYNVLQQNL